MSSLQKAQFSFTQQQHLKKYLCTFFLKAKLTDTEEEVYIYAAVSAARLNKLLEQINSDKPFNIHDYCSVHLAGKGEPGLYRAFFIQRYNFGEQKTNVTIMPPTPEDEDSSRT